MAEFNPDAPVIIEKVSGGGRMRQFKFSADKFNSIDEIESYLQEQASGGYDIGKYEIRQPVTTLSITVENEYPYSTVEQQWLAETIQEFETTFGVLKTNRITTETIERQATRGPYEVSISYRNCDFSVTVDTAHYDYDTVENALLQQVSTASTIFLEGKTENFKRGDREPSSITLFFSLERQQGQVDKARNLYHKLRQIAQQTEKVQTCVLARDIAVGTTHSYVLGTKYPDNAVLIDVREFETDEETFLDDVIFTTEMKQEEAFDAVRATLEKYTNETKQIYSSLFAPFVTNVKYKTDVLGAGEFSSGSTNRLLLGIQPSDD